MRLAILFSSPIGEGEPQSAVEGNCLARRAWGVAPSTTLRVVPGLNRRGRRI
jgi:hypothetical protein